jgi:hypothetical protein
MEFRGGRGFPTNMDVSATATDERQRQPTNACE